MPAVKLTEGSALNTADRIEGEIPRGQKPKRAAAFEIRLNPVSQVSNPSAEQSLEGDALTPPVPSERMGFGEFEPTPRRPPGPRGAGCCGRGKGPEGGNPMSVSGMK